MSDDISELKLTPVIITAFPDFVIVIGYRITYSGWSTFTSISSRGKHFDDIDLDESVQENDVIIDQLVEKYNEVCKTKSVLIGKQDESLL